MRERVSLKDKTVSALFYSFGSFIANSGIQFVIGIILARLLLPKDYGLLGMIMVFIAISQTFIDGGMTTALIREKEVSNEDYSTVFYYNLLLAIVMYALLFISANAISLFFREPLLVVIIRVAGLNLIIGSFGLIQRTILVRKLDFKTQTKIEVIASVSSGALAIYLAYHGYGVWALVIKLITMQIITSFLFVVYNKWIPLFTFNLNSFKKLFGFGWKMLVTGLLATTYQNIYNVIIGRMYSTTQLGYYTKAYQISEMAIFSIVTPVTKVSYPVLSKLREDNESFKAGFKKIIKNASFLTLPVMVGLAAVAEPLIQVLFGDNWVPMVPYFQILCLCGWLTPHVALNYNLMLVKGRSDLFLGMDIVNLFIGLISIGIALAFNLGIYGLLWIRVINGIIALFVTSYFSKEFVSYSTKEQIGDIIPAVTISILMGIVVYISGLMLPLHNAVKLPLQVTIGVITYIALSKLARIEELDMVYQLIKPILQKLKTRIAAK